MTTSHCIVFPLVWVTEKPPKIFSVAGRKTGHILDTASGRRFEVPVRDLLILMGDIQKPGFIEVIARQLQADRAAGMVALSETAGMDMPGKPARLVESVKISPR